VNAFEIFCAASLLGGVSPTDQLVPRRVLVIFQAFPPDPAAGGQCVADVCDTMVRLGASVRVIAADRGYDDPSTRFRAREHWGAIEVLRVGLASFGKTSLMTRLIGSLCFVANAIARGLTSPRPDTVLVSNSPPLAPLAGLIVAAWHRSRLVHWLMDLNPDQAVAMGLVRRTAVSARLLDWLNRCVLRRAKTVIVLDHSMAQRLAAKGPIRAELLVIPPWGGVTEPVLEPEAGRQFRTTYGLQDRFVVMYSGNHSLVHPLGTILDAAERLRDDPRFVFAFVGGGHGKTDVETRCLPNVLSLPYQPREALVDSLSAADIHIVAMGDNMMGIVHPSKIYSILAVGRPVLYLGPRESHVAEIVERNHLGWSIRHGDVEGVVEALRSALAQTLDERMTIVERARTLLAKDYQPTTLRQQVAQAVLQASSR